MAAPYFRGYDRNGRVNEVILMQGDDASRVSKQTTWVRTDEKSKWTQW